MKTLLFTLEFPPFKGGVANYYQNLSDNWPKNEYISVLHNNDGRLLSNYLWPKWLPAVFRLNKKIKKEKIDHIIAGHILPLGTVCLILSRFKKFSYSVILHGLDFSMAIKSKRKRKISLKILNQATVIICANSVTAARVKEFLGEKSASKVETVNPGVNVKTSVDLKTVENLKVKHKLDKKIIFFTVCRLVKRKGVDRAIEAIKKSLQYNGDIFYFIAGQGPEEENLKNLSGECPNIVFLGGINEEEKWAWFYLCQAFIMTAQEMDNDYEGFGIVYLEAGLLGKPVIAGDSGGIKDAVIGAETGILTNPQDSENISDAINRLAQDNKLRKELGERARQRILRSFDWQKQAEKFFLIINK